MGLCKFAYVLGQALLLDVFFFCVRDTLSVELHLNFHKSFCLRRLEDGFDLAGVASLFLVVDELPESLFPVEITLGGLCVSYTF
jgi:hypothetical protein